MVEKKKEKVERKQERESNMEFRMRGKKETYLRERSHEGEKGVGGGGWGGSSE
jgi:hypothetical protein